MADDERQRSSTQPGDPTRPFARPSRAGRQRQGPPPASASRPTRTRLVCRCGRTLVIVIFKDRRWGGERTQMMRPGLPASFRFGDALLRGFVCRCGQSWRVSSADVHDAIEAGARSVNVVDLRSAEPWPAFSEDPLRTQVAQEQARALADAHRAIQEAQRRHLTRIAQPPTIAQRRGGSAKPTEQGKRP